MAFNYINSDNVSFLMTSQSLKQKLISLSGDEFEELNAETPAAYENQDIQEFLSKFNINIDKFLNSNDLVNFAESFLTPEEEDDLTILFSMERVHFFAIFYLFEEGLLTKDEIKDIIKMSYSTRSDILLEKLIEEEATNTDFISPNNVINNFFEDIKRNNRRLTINTTEKIEWSNNIKSHNALITQESLKKIKKDLERRDYLFTDEPFKFVEPDYDYTLIDNRGIFTNPWRIPGLLKINNRIGWSQDGTKINYSTKDFLDYILNNTYLDLLIENYDKNRFFNKKLSENINFSNNTLEIKKGTQKAIAYVFNPTSEKPSIQNYFNTLKEIYTAQTSTTIPNDFVYITNTPIKNYMDNLFPTFSTSIYSNSLTTPPPFEKEDKSYLTEYLFNLKPFFYSESKSNFNPKRNLLDQLKDLSLFVGEDQKLEFVSLDLLNRLKPLFEEKIKNIGDLLIDDISGMTTIETFLSSINTEIQTLKNEDLGDLNLNIGKMAILDLFDKYITYLENNQVSTFTDFSVSNETFNTYKMILFIQQTFANLDKFMMVQIGYHKNLDIFLLLLQVFNNNEATFFSREYFVKSSFYNSQRRYLNSIGGLYNE